MFEFPNSFHKHLPDHPSSFKSITKMHFPIYVIPANPIYIFSPPPSSHITFPFPPPKSIHFRLHWHWIMPPLPFSSSPSPLASIFSFFTKSFLASLILSSPFIHYLFLKRYRSSTTHPMHLFRLNNSRDTRVLCPLNESFFSDDLRLFLVGILGSSISIVSDRWPKIGKSEWGASEKSKGWKLRNLGGGGGIARGTAGNGKDLS